MLRQLLQRALGSEHDDARVTLAEMRRTIELLFHAGGGAHDLSVRESSAQPPGGPRGWLRRTTGLGTQPTAHAPPLLHTDALALPASLAHFNSRALNRDLYVWLAALAACHVPRDGWIADNRRATQAALTAFPGLRSRHERLVAAHIATRPDPVRLNASAARAERSVRAALVLPNQDDHVDNVTDAAHGWHALQASDVAPVWLWLHLSPERLAQVRNAARTTDGELAADSPTQTQPKDRQARVANGAEAAPQPDRPDVTFFQTRSLLSWSTPVQTENKSGDGAGGDALSEVGFASDTPAPSSPTSTNASVHFDLDRGSAAADDVPIGPGLRLPEWSWKEQRLLPDFCTAQLQVVRHAARLQPTPELQRTAQRVRKQLEALRSQPRRTHGEPSGDEIDIDAWVRHISSERAAPQRRTEAPVYSRLHRTERSLACLLLADLSMSTVGWANDEVQIIQLIRDALYVFGEALTALGDPFAMVGFSSVRRHNVRLQLLKSFAEPWSDATRARLGAIQPNYYTRMGAAVRFATREMQLRPERQRLMLLLTDGKPNDLDVYEGRWGLEDTREAVLEARAAGLLPFCITIDREGHDYLPHLFGKQGYAVVHQPTDLVDRLTSVYTHLLGPR